MSWESFCIMLKNKCTEPFSSWFIKFQISLRNIDRPLFFFLMLEMESKVPCILSKCSITGRQCNFIKRIFKKKIVRNLMFPFDVWHCERCFSAFTCLCTQQGNWLVLLRLPPVSKTVGKINNCTSEAQWSSAGFNSQRASWTMKGPLWLQAWALAQNLYVTEQVHLAQNLYVTEQVSFLGTTKA